MSIDEKIQQALNAPDDCGYARLAKDLARFLQESRAPAAVAPADDGWIPWLGGDEPPVAGNVNVCIKFRHRVSAGAPLPAGRYRWDDIGSDADIVAYKVVA